MRRPRLPIVLSLLALLVVAAGATAALLRHREAEREEAEAAGESVVAFAREHAGGAAHRLPAAVLREKLEHGKEARREIISGPSQQQVDQRAYPRTYVSDRRAAVGRRAFRAAPTRLTRRDFRSARSLRGAQRAALAADWQELGPVTPRVPGAVTYTGAPTKNSGRTTALAIDPGCGAVGRDCRMWVGAAGGGVFRTDDAHAGRVAWVPSSSGLTTTAIGSLLVDPSDPSGDTVYAGTGEPNGSSDSEAGQGLFRSRDGGRTWASVPGSVAVARDRSVASIAVDPGDANHLYIGTALARHGSSSSNGGRRTPPGAPTLGLYESTDGGQTFRLAFSKPTDRDRIDPDPTPGGLDLFTGGVNRVQLDPRAPGTVYVALFGYGIWRRAAGQTTFAHVFQTKYAADTVAKDDDGHPLGDSAGDRTEFDLVPIGSGAGAHTRIYAGDSSDDNGYSALWRSDAAEGPRSEVTGGSATADPANGPAWTLLSKPDIADTKAFTSWFFCHEQCGYDIFVRADPARPDVVYLGGSLNYDEIFGAEGEGSGGVTAGRTNGRAVVRSTDAGASFTDMTNAVGPTVLDQEGLPGEQYATGMHPDQHALVFDPSAPDRVFVGSDGGVVRTSGAFADDSARCDGRKLAGAELALCKQALSAVPTGIDALNEGLATLQFQSLSVNPANPLTDVIGGTQDNGTWAFTGSPDWTESIGGDGGQSAVDAAAGARVHTYYGPAMDVNFNGNDPLGWDYMSQPLDDANAGCGTNDPRGECFSFYVPLARDPRTPGTLFTGGEYVWRTQDDGGPRQDLESHCRETAIAPAGDDSIVCGDWQRLGGGQGHLGTAANYIVATERAPSDAGTLWVGRRRGGLFVSSNADASPVGRVRFKAVGAASLPGRFVSSIHVDPADPNHAWVSYSGYSVYTPQTPGHVFDVHVDPQTGKATAADITNGLGDIPVTDLVRDDPTGDLYAGTDFGVVRLPAGATTWEQAAGDLPTVAVYGLTISTDGRVLYAATHGRGAWRVALPALPQAAASAPSAAALAPGGDTPGEPPASGRRAPSPARIGRTRVSSLHLASGGRIVRLSVGLAATTRATIRVYDQRGRRLGQRQATVRRDGSFVYRLTVRPRSAVTARSRWRVTVTAQGPGETARRSLRFAP